MAFFSKNKKTDPPEQRFLESTADAPFPEDPGEADDKTLNDIAMRDARAHCSVTELLIFAVIILFFGTMFIVLSDKQNFSDKEKLTKENFLSGEYTEHLSERFKENIPMRDRFGNYAQIIEYSFGIGNDVDLKEIKNPRDAQDPFDVDDADDGFIPIDDNGDVFDDNGDDEEERLPDDTQEETSDNGKNRPIESILIPQQQEEETSSSESETASVTTTNNRAPGATTTTTVPPQTTQPPQTTPPQTAESTADTSSTTAQSSAETSASEQEPELPTESENDG